jgi:hypothetical protein
MAELDALGRPRGREETLQRPPMERQAGRPLRLWFTETVDSQAPSP